jgi:hypothetical protein
VTTVEADFGGQAPPERLGDEKAIARFQGVTSKILIRIRQINHLLPYFGRISQPATP